MTAKDNPVSKRLMAERAQAKAEAESDGINKLILALDDLNKAIAAYAVAHIINLALQQIRDDLDEEITALMKERGKSDG